MMSHNKEMNEFEPSKVVDASVKGPELSMNSLAAHLSTQFSVEYNTAYLRTLASDQCTHGREVSSSWNLFMRAIWFNQVSEDSMELHDIPWSAACRHE